LPHRPIITLTTDFGLHDHFVGTVKGVILNILPEAEIVDITHSIQPFDILDGALSIAAAYSYFPAGTVHLVVVDPGVGSPRRPIIASTEKHEFVAPDNGVLSLVYHREERLRVVAVNAPHYYLQPVSHTFHARDVFGPVAAYLAKGVAVAKFGEEVSDFVRHPFPRPQRVDERRMRGMVLKVDTFGNLLTNLSPSDIPELAKPGAQVGIAVNGKLLAGIKNSYAEGGDGEVFGIVGSMGYLEIVSNRQSAAQILGAAKGAEIAVVLSASNAATG
jgi:S-adenosylmethionine hydrolase